MGFYILVSPIFRIQEIFIFLFTLYKKYGSLAVLGTLKRFLINCMHSRCYRSFRYKWRNRKLQTSVPKYVFTYAFTFVSFCFDNQRDTEGQACHFIYLFLLKYNSYNIIFDTGVKT